MTKVLEQIVAKIGDQRYLFVLAVAVASPFVPNPWLGATIVVGAFGLVYLVSLREHPGAPDRSVSMALMLEFPPDVDATLLVLQKCRYTVSDAKRPNDTKTGEVKPYRAGDGWLCPLPHGTNARDVVDLEFEDGVGTKWSVYGFVPDLQWPPVKVQRSV